MSPPTPEASPFASATADKTARQGRRRAVITGIGPITCIGTGVDHFWKGILAERSGIGSITSFDPSVFGVRCAGEIRDWNPEEFFQPHRLKRLDRYAQFAVVSAKLALDDARIEYSREKPQDRIGVSFGTALGGVCKAEEQYIDIEKGARESSPRSLSVFGGSAHSNVAIDSGFAAWALMIQTAAPVAWCPLAKRFVTFEMILRM
jgi:3-oxoacyl-[acyl-carrier-protein] synthase II